jgi:hypothetical protein
MQCFLAMGSDEHLEEPVPLVGFLQSRPERRVDSITTLARECSFAVYAPDPWPEKAVGQPRYSVLDPPEWPNAPVKLPRSWAITAGELPTMLMVTGNERLEGWHAGKETLGSRLRNWPGKRARREHSARLQFPDVDVTLVAVGVSRRVFRRAVRSLERLT